MKAMIDTKNIEFEQEYDRTYESHFRKLAEMPSDTTEAKQERWEYCHSQMDWDQFLLDTLRAFYVDLRHMDEKASDRYAAVFDCLKEIIETYHSEMYSFRICLARLLMQRESMYQLQKEQTYGRFALVGSAKKKQAFGKLVNEIQSLLAKEGKSIEGISREQFATLATFIQEERSSRVADADIDALYRMLVMKEIESLDKSMNDEGEGGTLGEVISDTRALNANESAENRMQIAYLIDTICARFAQGLWLDLMDKEILGIFLTHEILRELKLDAEGRTYENEPAGNPDIYEILRPKEKGLMEIIFHKEYLPYVFGRTPEDFYKVYAWILNEGVKLIDTDIVKCFDYASRGTVSKKRARYRELMRAFSE